MKYLQIARHANHIMVGGIVLITVGEHQPHVCSKLLSVSVLSAVHFFLLEKTAVNSSHPSVLVSVSFLMITSLGLNLSAASKPKIQRVKDADQLDGS